MNPSRIVPGSLPIVVLNGPNLNLLGTREPSLYGTATLVEIEDRCRQVATSLGFGLEFFQTNHEGELIGAVQGHRASICGIVLNPGGYAHTSVALADAVALCEVPVVEVHLTNIFRREPFRHHSYISAVAEAVLCGCGASGYELAVRYLASRQTALGNGPEEEDRRPSSLSKDQR